MSSGLAFSRIACVSACAALAAAAVPSVAAAATINVTTDADVLAPNDGLCSLREGVRAANDDAASGPAAGECTAGGGPDTIRLPTGDFALSLTGAGEDVALTGDLDLVGTLEVIGSGIAPGASGTDVRGMDDRIFDVRPGAVVRISNLRVRNGNPPDGLFGTPVAGGPGANGVGGPGNPGSDGGGILNAATLTLDHVLVANNAAGNGGAGGSGTGGDGGAGMNGGSGQGGASATAGDGGAIHSTGTLVIRDSTITQNFGGTGLTGGSGFGGRGGDGDPAGHGGSASGGKGGDGGIGGISVASGSLTMSGTVVSDNTGGRGGDGGGTFNGRGGDGTGNGNGGDGATNQAGSGGPGGAGGIGGAGSITISTSAIEGNEAGDGGNGGTAFTGAGGTGGGATGDGGIGGSAVGGTGGEGGDGGGIDASSLITIERSLVAGNSAGAAGRGGGAMAGGAGMGSPAGLPGVAAGGSGGTGGFGGGMNASGMPPVVNVTLDANVAGAGGDGGGATTFGGPAFGGTGGNGGSGGNAFFAGGSLSHLTVTGGTAGAGGAGGTAEGGTNTAGGGGAAGTGAGLTAGLAGITFANSIAAATACGGPVTDGGHNIAFNSLGCPGAAVDPLLGPLADNGGPTKTRRLPVNSPAVDEVPATGANCASTDQRGAVRPFGTACDAGAFELAPPAAATGPAEGIGSTSATVTGTATPRGLPATYRFEFGETTAYGQTSPTGSSASETPAGVVAQLTGLKPSATYHYRLVVVSPDGQAAGEDATFATQAAPAGPVLSALRVRPARFRVARGATPRGPARTAAVPRGTRISYRLSSAATVRLAIQRARKGVRVRRRGRNVCVAASPRRLRQTPRRLHCTLYRTRGRLTRNAAAGRNRVRFTGRIGRRALPRGRYRVVAFAQNAAGRSASRRAAFRIVGVRR